MGSIPLCFCVQRKKQLIINSEVIFQDFENYNESNIKGKRESLNSLLNRKSEIDNYKNTLSIKKDFINPLPDIVIIKHKNLWSLECLDNEYI